MGGEVVGRAPHGVGDTGREQTIGDGLGVHVGEAGLVQVLDKGRLERLHEFGEWPGLSLDGQRCPYSVSGRTSQLGGGVRRAALKW